MEVCFVSDQEVERIFMSTHADEIDLRAGRAEFEDDEC